MNFDQFSEIFFVVKKIDRRHEFVKKIDSPKHCVDCIRNLFNRTLFIRDRHRIARAVNIRRLRYFDKRFCRYQPTKCEEKIVADLFETTAVGKPKIPTKEIVHYIYVSAAFEPVGHAIIRIIRHQSDFVDGTHVADINCELTTGRNFLAAILQRDKPTAFMNHIGVIFFGDFKQTVKCVRHKNVVGMQYSNVFPARDCKSGFDCRTLTHVFFMPKQFESRIAGLFFESSDELFDNFCTSIGRGIVDYDMLELAEFLCNDTPNTIDNVMLAIVHRGND